MRIKRKRFGDLESGAEIRHYLRRVLSRTGGIDGEKLFLYHYTSIDSLYKIMESGYMWLGSTQCMNDYLEGEIIGESGDANKLFYSCFSKSEENLAMYKMYAPHPDGVMLVMSFSAAREILDSQMNEEGYNSFRIVNNNTISKDVTYGEIYWSSVCYKDLKSNMIFAGGVQNQNISNPLDEPDLAGYIKLFGWKYEEEVRLCVSVEDDLDDGERIAIRIPKSVYPKLSYVTCPGFDVAKNKSPIAQLKRMGIARKASEYDGLVDIGTVGNMACGGISAKDIDEKVAGPMSRFKSK